VAVIPSAVLGLAFDAWFDTHFYNYIVVALMLIVYGVAFLWVEEKHNKTATPRVTDVSAIDWKTALLIGAFQCLALIPGTSRSGSTILGSILLGVSRSAASEFSFFLAIPTMLGASALKALVFLTEGNTATSTEILVLITGMAVSFAVSLVVIRGLMDYVRRRSFSVFGIYRIVLGALVLLYAFLH
jgi:undecaprenyl-diphosphatase